MSQDRSNPVDGHINAKILPMDEKSAATGSSSRTVKPHRHQTVLMPILALAVILVLLGLWRWRTARQNSAAFRANLLESSNLVRNATTGAWVDNSEIWSRFGVLGAAFDGERIVMSSAQSANGSLACHILPREQPVIGTCYEFQKNSLATGENVCSWQIILLEISPGRIRGARFLQRDESDAVCAHMYTKPSQLIFERLRK